MAVTEPVVRLAGVSKSFGGVTAVSNVDFALNPGRITGLAGENGAGKSTLIRLLGAAIRPDAGTLEIDGRPVPPDPRQALQAGVSIVYQELTDVPDMSVADNLLLDALPNKFGIVRRTNARKQARAVLSRLGLDSIRLDQPVSALTLAQRQLLEVARCLAREARVIVFDEPTSSLPESEVAVFMGVVRHLRDQGLAILYVTHHLDEFFTIADEIVVMRDGEVVATKDVGQWTEPELIRAMLAKPLDQAYPFRPREIGAVALKVDELRAPRVHSASLVAREREVVGLVGLEGSGRTELMQAIGGITPAKSGTILVSGQPVHHGRIDEARRHGLIYVPEDRKRSGLLLEASVEDNLIVGNYAGVSRAGILSRRNMQRESRRLLSDFAIRARSVEQPIGTLSGGNQQKALIARFARSQPAVIMLDDPTRGVGVGSKASIYEKIFELAESGTAVVLTSSDTDEILAVTDRCYVLQAGRIVAEVQRGQYDREELLQLAALG